jgi:hypothetical protein
VDGAAAVDHNGSSPSAKRMKQAMNGEIRSKHAHAPALQPPMRADEPHALAFARCSDLP